MAALSVATVVLSLTDGCPGLPFYVLEVIINTAMILEVGIRFVALGKVGKFCFKSSAFLTSFLSISNFGSPPSTPLISCLQSSVH